MECGASLACLGLLATLALPAAAAADDPGGAAGASPLETVRIDAKTMRVVADEQRAIFRGAVTVRRGADRLTCQTLTVRYDTEGAVESFVAEGKVHMQRAERHLRAERAELDNRRNLLTLTGDPVMEEGPNVVHGEVIRYDLASGEVEVVQVRARVEIDRLREKTP